MEIIHIKKTRQRENLYVEKLNVAAYARVSTKFEKQAFSLDSQIKYYTDYIIRNNNWNFIKVYSDDGVSGTKLKNRDGFVEMVNDAMNGKIDLIYTKSVSRFARNTIDLLSVVRTLKEKGVTIVFEEENINTSTLEGELLLSVLASVAQTEADNLSEHIALGYEMSRRLGKPTKTLRPYGYNFNKENKLIINKKEAKVVKLMFEMALNGESSNGIATYFNQNKIKSQKNAGWSGSTISKFLRREIYIGTLIRGQDAKYGKVYRTENDHEPIIDKDTFYKVQSKFKNNIKVEKRDYRIENIYCGFCGNRIREILDRKFLSCYFDRRNKKTNCVDSRYINNFYFKEVFVNLLFKILSVDYNYSRINRKITNLIKLRDKYYEDNKNLVDLYINKRINDYHYNIESKSLNENISKTEKELSFYESNKISEKRFEQIKNDIIQIIIDTVDDINDFSYELFNKIISFTIIGEVRKVRTKDPFVIRFYYDDRKLFIESETKKNYLEYAKEFVPYIKFYYKKDIRSFNTQSNGKRKYNKKNRIKVIFFVRKDESKWK